jgi:hypothetical protein
LQEQLSENKKQRQVIEEIAGRKKQKKQDAETAKNRETLKSGGSTKKKKRKGDEVEDQERTPKKKRSKKKKPVEVEEVETDEVETDVLETCVIFRHTSDKQGEVKVKVEWGDSGTKDWQFLYDMWADYPTEVMEYKKKNQKATRGKFWNVPTIDNVTYFVRILCMIGGEEKIEDATFIVLANNGYKFDGEDCVKYDELQNDDPDLLKAFLDSPEADDASIA